MLRDRSCSAIRVSGWRTPRRKPLGGPGDQGRRGQDIGRRAPDLPHDPKEDELKLQAHAAGLSPRFTDEVDVLLVGVGAMGGLVAQTFADAG